jgi:hypothetical protein
MSVPISAVSRSVHGSGTTELGSAVTLKPEPDAGTTDGTIIRPSVRVDGWQ